MFIRPRLIPLVVISAALALTACSAPRTVERAEQFATAGIEYTEAVPAVMDESFALAVTANSLQLERDRKLFSEDDRLRILTETDAEFEKRLAVLRDLKRHAELLRDYFVAFRALAQSDAATGITDVTTGLIGKLGELNQKITDAKTADVKIGGAQVSDLVGPAVGFAVGAFKNAAIRKEIEAHGETIERELALQEAALTVLTEQMIADKDLEIQITERNPIFLEYVTGSSLPKDWTARRIRAYRKTVAIESINEATQASAGLHQAWVALSENRLDEQGLLLLLKDIGELADLARKFRAE